MFEKKVFGISLILCGTILGLIVGLWLCLIGGVSAILQPLIEQETYSMAYLTFNSMRILLGGLCIWLGLKILISSGLLFLRE
jgi:hypothetical protein